MNRERDVESKHKKNKMTFNWKGSNYKMDIALIYAGFKGVLAKVDRWIESVMVRSSIESSC